MLIVVNIQHLIVKQEIDNAYHQYAIFVIKWDYGFLDHNYFTERVVHIEE